MAREPLRTFPTEAYNSAFLHPLLHSIYKTGKPLTPEENSFLISLKTHPSAISLAIDLLFQCQELYAHQFAATLLTQALEVAESSTISDELAQYLATAVYRYVDLHGANGEAAKIRRHLMGALGLVLRTQINWMTQYRHFLLSIQPDVFTTLNPSDVALDSLFILSKFNGLRMSSSEKSVSEWEGPELVFDFFIRLLSGNIGFYDERQALYLRIISEWLRDVSCLGTPGEKTGDLMVFVAKFIDCPKRQQFPWGSVQVQAALTLGEFLGLSDIHLLQNSLLEVLRIILNFPMVDRVRSMTSFEDVQGYLETMAKVLLEFNLEFADVVVACSEKPETKGLLVELVKRLRLLADPFPERQPGTFCEQAFSKDAIIAFSELSSIMYEMCGSGSEVANIVLSELKEYFHVLVKMSYKPTRTLFSTWSQEEKESYHGWRRDSQKAIESFALAVHQPLYSWFLEDFQSCVNSDDPVATQKKFSALCFLLRHCFSNKVNKNTCRFLFDYLRHGLSQENVDVVCEAFGALETWIPLSLDDDTVEKDMLRPFIQICVMILGQKNDQLTNACAPALSALMECIPEEMIPFYPQLTEGIVVNLANGIGKIKARGKLISSLGHLIVILQPNDAASEIDKLFPVFQAMLKSQQVGIVIKTLGIFPGFFRSIGHAALPKKSLAGVDVIDYAVVRLGLNLIQYLHNIGIFSCDLHSQTIVDEVCSNLIKSLLYASGSAVGKLLAIIVPFIGDICANNQSAGILACISELLTVYLNNPGYEILFGQLCVHMFSSIIQFSSKENWAEYTDLYRPFILAAYPVVKNNSVAFTSLPIDWENLLNLVIKLIFLAPSGGADSIIQSNILFEELLRMRDKESPQNIAFVNHFKKLILEKYGRDLVVAFLTTIRDPASDERQVKTCADCLFAMLIEMTVECREWLQNSWRLIAGQDITQQAAFEKLISSILTQSHKYAMTRQVAMYRRKFLLHK